MVYPYNGILFYNKRKWSHDSYSLDEPENVMQSERSHFQMNTMWFHLYGMSRIGKSLETVDRFLRLGEVVNGDLLLMGIGFLWGLWECSKIDWAVYTALWIYQKPTELYTLNERILWYVNYLNKLPSNKKKKISLHKLRLFGAL